jgi:hypothetical protein
MSFLTYDFEPAILARRIVPTGLFLRNKMLQARFANALSKGLEFFLLALRHQLDPAIGQISHRPGNFKSRGDRFHRITKPNTLHVAGVKNVHLLAIHTTVPRQCATIGLFREENQPSTGFDSRDKAIARQDAQWNFLEFSASGRTIDFFRFTPAFPLTALVASAEPPSAEHVRAQANGESWTLAS